MPSWYEGTSDQAANPGSTKEFKVLKRTLPDGPAEEVTITCYVGDEITKLEKQLADERFLTKAPASAIESAKKKYEKLLKELPALPRYVNRVLDDASPYGYYWAVEGNEIWCLFLNEEGERYGVAVGFIFKTEEALETAWEEVNTYWMGPLPWQQAIWNRERREEEEAEKKLYLKLKAKYENVNADSTTPRAVE